jgi:hypothetical protein
MQRMDRAAYARSISAPAPGGLGVIGEYDGRGVMDRMLVGLPERQALRLLAGW